ncbi:SspB-related isopeptide-forming adhesin [Ligilactobacillus salivarius]|uniref:SspB-related isopeptide-forming adhesin n=1 Tax=Ligilactobacillus salivarius TaxID=1624 RepID=UPI001F50B08C|nr:SspB-related isopeptide-forming adhesin [Ligilactobacillus salivarius]
MTETKLHYKLYKTKHGWVTATIAATALAIPIISGSVTNHASADTTATTGTQTVTSGSNAVTATTASATSATSNTQSVTPDSSKLDQAVQNAKSTANVTVNQTPTQTVTGSTVAEAKQKAEQDYSSQAATINQKVANQKANNDATNAANSFNMDNAKKRELDQAVQNAKSTANVTVNQTQTQIYNTNASGVENTKNKINNDYSTQINNINQAVSAQKAKNDAYNKAVAEANTLNKSTADTTRKNLDDAIKAAQAVKGVTLIDDGTSTSTVSVSDFEAKKKQIQDQNTQQANSINAQIQQYKDIYTKWEKDNQQFLEAAAAKTGWSVQQVLDFLGKDLPNVSYVSAGSNMTFDKGSLQSFSQSELNSILSNPKVDPGLKGYVSSKAYGNLYKLSQGVSWKYNNAFTDTKSGKSVDLKVTVQGLGLDYSGRYGLPPMIMVGEKYIGSDVAGIGAVKYGLTFLEHGTNTPINITSLIGVGDVDAKQSVAVYNATSALRGSENKNYSGDDYLGSINTNGIDDFSEGKNTQYQSWFLVPNSSTISYVFSAADPAWGNVAPDGSGFMGFYHQNLGGIPLPIKNTPPTPPTVKYNHTNVALEKPTPTEVTYHYDTIMPATIPGGTPISYHYNEISVPIPNPTKKADKEGKTLIAGDESTQHISQYTGVNQKLDKFAVGDAIQYTNDGRLPVSFDLSRWTVTTSNGANVTAQGKFTQYDKTFEGKKYHVVSWSPTNVSSLKDNETYTLNTVLKTLNDGITDGEIDRAVGGGDGVTFGEAHGYDEFNPTTDKHWVEGSQKVDGKTYIDGDTIHGQVTMTLPDKNSLAKALSTVQIIDDYSKFADKVDYKSAQVLENGKDVTSEYNISNAYGQVVATRKNAGATPSGNVVLNVTWTIHKDVKSGTQLVNSGSGRINSHTVPTPDRNIVTYKQDTEKHWRDDGGQIVDGKIAINDDVVTARVDMTLPKEENLAKPLDKIQLVDDFSKFADKVTLQAVHVYENGKDVTDQYDIHVENGKVVATRKDASKVYDHTGAANATMKATLKANEALNVNDLVHTASANVNDNKVSTVNRLAFSRLFAKSFITSNIAVINDNNIKSQIDMAVPTNVDAKTPMTVTSDYSNFAKYVNVKDATVYENGKNVTADYTIKDDKAGHVTATKKAGSESDGGQVSLVVDYEVNHGIPNGTILENHGSGTLNGQDVPTNTPSITTYNQDTSKHWVEGDQNVDGKIYVNGSTAHAQVNMTLPDQTKLINKLSNVSIDDDYSKFAKLVDYKSAKVLENGKDVTSEYSIKNANGHVTAVRKDASKTPAGNVQLLVDFEIHKDVKSGTELVNAGSGTLNKNTVPTNTPSITTYTPDGEKHWVLDNNVTDNKIYFSGDKAVAQVSVDLPDASKLATPLNKLVLVDNYSDFADKVKLDNAKVLENGKDVTSEYDLTNKDGKVVATRKEAAKTPSGKAVLVTTFTINNGVENATALHNKGSVTVDSITDEVPDTPIVVFTPQAHKDVELGGDVKGDTENSVDGSLILNGSVVTYPITTSDLPAERAEDITKRVVKDTLDKNAEFVGFKAWVENDKGELEDVTSHYKLDKNGQDLTFTEDSYLLGLYNKDKSKQTHTPIIDLVVKVKGDAQKITNKATVLTNDNVTETNEVSVDTPAKPTPTKVDKNEKGVNIDGKNVLPGSVNNYELTMDLSKFKGIKVTDQDLAKGFYFVDDYPEKALDVDPQTFTSKTVDGKTVKGLSAKVYQSLSEVPSDVAAVLKANNITPKGAFVLISADNPAQFFKDYVETGTNITVNAPMKVKAGFAGKYENKAWQLTFGQGEATDIVSNNVPKIDPKKDIVISADNRTSLNNHTIELGQNFDYLLKGGILDKDQGHDIYEYKWIDDYDQNHDQYNGQFIAPLTVDVALKDGTVLKAGTDISNHVSQNIDTKTGSVEFSVDKDFLDKVDFDKGGFAADILMSVKRIKAGEVDNTYTNIINGQKFGSNTVHSTTPEPKTPETPATPQTPTTTPSASVTTPQTPATPQPVKMVTSTPSKAPESPALPQMGETNDTLAEEVVGFAAIVAALGMAGTSLKKRKD